MRTKELLMDLVEMIESEFPTLSWDELTQNVLDVIAAEKTFESMNDADKYDYLVDSIIEKQYA